MSYSSKHYQTNWSYDPHGNTHNDRIGQILARGVDLSSTLRNDAIKSVQTAKAFELEQKNAQHTAPRMDLISTPGSHKSDGRGMVWVDAEGQTLGPVTEETFKEPLAATSPLDMCNERQLAVATMDNTQRSMHLWRKINPGCMASTLTVPTATTKEHFREREGLVPVIDKTMHRHKTEFTDYVEAKMKFGSKLAKAG